ncbi:MAG TPA: hypothetical protein VGN57_07595 [Pirellulaceae bacterium]|jgi:hypothetical protein|nr:hypothetical protein [Pirellulaceae bacterium]
MIGSLLPRPALVRGVQAVDKSHIAFAVNLSPLFRESSPATLR